MENQGETAGVAYGRGIAAIITTGFGFVWIGWGLSSLRTLPPVIWLFDVSVAAVLMAFGLIAVRRGRKMMRAAGESRGDFWQPRRKAFRVLTLLEVAGCILVAISANLFRRPDWIAVGISFVVGLHFLPLGRIFGVASYYWVGTLIVICDLLTITTLKPWNWTAAAGIATGTILWVVAIRALTRSFRVVSPGRSSLI